jgi:hypothetical protein
MTHPIPAEALAYHIAILGKTGSGKSNAAKVVAEDLMSRGERVCAIDPTGTWWGLRLDAGGKKPSPHQVAIFGGSHADLPIGATHGAAVAEAIGTSSTSAIIDTRLMKVGERTKFFTDFAETLLQRNRGPLHLIIDECHVFMPQGKVPDPQSGMMLHAANNLVSLGRGIGLRIILISQRPAKVHKDSLTQVETLVAQRLIAPQDRRAIEDWIGEWAGPKQGAEVLYSLPSMKTGDAWIWSPELGHLERARFSLAKTFDSGRPRIGEAGPELQPIDLTALKGKLTTVEAEFKANDPKALRAEIAALKRQLASQPVEKINTPDPAATEEAEKRGYAEGYRAGRDEGGRSAAHNQMKRVIEGLVDAAMINGDGDALADALKKMKEIVIEARAPEAPARQVARPAPQPIPKRDDPLPSNGHLSPSARAILDVIHRSHPVSLSFDAAARRAGISKRSSAYRKYRHEVEGSQEVTFDGQRFRSLMPSGGDIDPRATIDQWVAKLPPSYGNMLRAVADLGPVDKSTIAEHADVSPTSSGLGAGLRELQDLELIVFDGNRYSLAEGLA